MERTVLLLYALLAAAVLLVPAAALLARAGATPLSWAAYAASAVLIATAYASVLAGEVYDGRVPWPQVAAGTLLVLGAPLFVAGGVAIRVVRRRPATKLPTLLALTVVSSLVVVVVTRPAVARLLPEVMVVVQ